jgi:hypothetical protein
MVALVLLLLLFGLAQTHELNLVLGRVAVEVVFIAVLAASMWSIRGQAVGTQTKRG